MTLDELIDLARTCRHGEFSALASQSDILAVLTEVRDALSRRPAATSEAVSGDWNLDAIIEESVIGGTDDFPAINRASLIADLRNWLNDLPTAPASPARQTRGGVLEEALSQLLANYEHAPHASLPDLLRDLRALKSTLPAVEKEQDGWQDIATAPKDGTWIEAYRPREGIGTKALTVHVRWHQFGDGDSAWIWPDDTYEVFTEEGRDEAERLIDRGDIYEDATHFTHWRHLPPPPTQSGDAK